MKTKQKYWLVGYVYTDLQRNIVYANSPINIPPITWLLEKKKNSPSLGVTLLFMKEITKKEYDQLCLNL